VLKHLPAQKRWSTLFTVTAEAVEAKQTKEEVTATATKADGKRAAEETIAVKQAEEDVAAREEEEEENPALSVSSLIAVPSPLHGLRPAPNVACPL